MSGHLKNARKREIAVAGTGTRNYGIDLARILAMELVLLLHVVGWFSGLDKASVTGSWMASFSFCCVDLFALISGYVGVRNQFRFSRLVVMWLQIVFTGIIIVGIGSVMGFFAPTLKDWGKVFCPFTAHAYWYVSAYVGLFLAMPFLNAGLAIISRRHLKALLLFLVVLIVVLPAFNPFGGNTYALNNGMSPLWLMVCYLIGGGMRLLQIRASNVKLWLIISVGMVVLTHYYGGTYAHPIVLGAAFCYLMVCLHVKIKSGMVQRVVRFFSACAFGVYVWHGQPLLHANMKRCFAFMCDLNPVWQSCVALGLVILFYLVISCLEFGRMRLFAWLDVKGRVQRFLSRYDLESL